MMLFWLICAGFVAIALAFVLPPLLQTPGKKTADDDKEANVAVYRGQLAELKDDLSNGIVSEEQYQTDRDEIERRLLADVSVANSVSDKKTTKANYGRGPVYAVAILLPLIATVFYLRVGTPGAMTALKNARPQMPAAAGPSSAGQMSQQDIAGNVAKLAQRMEQNPNDVAGWLMLARSYVNLERFPEASNAFAKAVALKADDADVWADYAFAMGMANGKSLSGQPTELIKKSLALDPANAKALELAGSAAFEAKNYKEAIDYWQRLMQKTPKDSELGQALVERIEQAKTEAATTR